MAMTRASEATARSGNVQRAARDMQPHALKAAELLKALANEQRLMILCHLLEAPLSVSQLNERVVLSQSALSQHLAVLRQAAIVHTEREAQSVWYSLPPGVVRRLIAVLYGEFCKHRG